VSLEAPFRSTARVGRPSTRPANHRGLCCRSSPALGSALRQRTAASACKEGRWSVEATLEFTLRAKHKSCAFESRTGFTEYRCRALLPAAKPVQRQHALHGRACRRCHRSSSLPHVQSWLRSPKPNPTLNRTCHKRLRVAPQRAFVQRYGTPVNSTLGANNAQSLSQSSERAFPSLVAHSCNVERSLAGLSGRRARVLLDWRTRQSDRRPSSGFTAGTRLVGHWLGSYRRSAGHTVPEGYGMHLLSIRSVRGWHLNVALVFVVGGRAHWRQ
jgi:hypothetical protein